MLEEDADDADDADDEDDVDVEPVDCSPVPSQPINAIAIAKYFVACMFATTEQRAVGFYFSTFFIGTKTQRLQ